MRRRTFLQHAGVLTAGALIGKNAFGKNKSNYPVVRTDAAKRHFSSDAIEAAIKQFKAHVKDEEQGWLFENCFPNTLDTTVYYTEVNGRPDTYVITGDIDAMWLRDSCAQVWPYMSFIKEDEKLRKLIAGVINKQTTFVLKDPYANAFYNDANKVSEWKSDLTDMKPGVHERKWEIDSLCYTIRLAHGYWKATGDTAPFNNEWKEAIKLILQTFKEQQRKKDKGPYHFMRQTEKPTDTLPMGGYGFPAKPNGLICSMFRPSDDATIYPYLIPSNFFAVVSLKQAATMVSSILHDATLASELQALATEVETALKQHAIYTHPVFGKIYPFEIDGYGNYNLMDDANAPGLLSLPYFGAVSANDPVYQNTRKFVLSAYNPFFYEGTVAEGIGGPHIGKPDMIWPLSIVTRGLTSTDEKEIKMCIDMLKKTHAGTGFMHESFYKDDAKDFTRSWFAWANTIYGEFLWHTYKTKPGLFS